MANVTLVGMIRKVTGYKGYLQYGRGQEWVVLGRGNCKQNNEAIRKLSATFETWKLHRRYHDTWKGKKTTYDAISYHFIVRTVKGKLLGYAYMNQHSRRGESNVLVDYIRSPSYPIESFHRDTRTHDSKHLVSYERVSWGK